MKFTECLTLLDRTVNACMRPIVIVLSLLVAGMLALGIFTRIVLGAPMFGLEELVLICVMWLYMMGAILASKERSHLSADFVQTFVKNQKVVNFSHLITSIISLIIVSFFVSWSYDLFVWALEKKQTTPVFNIPWYLSQGSLLFAGVCMFFYTLRDVIHDLINLFNTEPSTEPRTDQAAEPCADLKREHASRIEEGC